MGATGHPIGGSDVVQNIPPVVRRKQLLELTGISRTQQQRLEDAGRFPRRFKLTDEGTAVAWDGREVAAWIEERIAASRQD